MKVFAEQNLPMCKPQATAFCAQGFNLMQRGDQVGAYHSYLAASRIDPRCAEAWVQMGAALTAGGQFQLALTFHRYALEFDKSAFQYLNYANSLAKNLHYDEARENFWKSIKLDDKNSKAWYGLAHMEMEEGNGTEARKYIDQALTLDPDVPDIHYTSAVIALMYGDWERGFSESYERRLEMKTMDLPKDLPRWIGQDLADKHLLVCCEQGFGDSFLFLRFLKLLPKECSRISLMVPKNLRRLVDYNYDYDYEIYNAGTHVPKVDYFVPLPSIPFCTLNSGRSFSVESEPYLSAPDVFFKRTPNARKAVGLCWKGDARHQDDWLRQVSPTDMVAELLRPSIDLCSLQVADEPDPVLCGEMGILRDLGKYFTDFYDTACVIKQLDCVVSIDTSVANLCGAMGKECHVLIPYGGVDWRWMQGCERSPWYPSVVTHRQAKGEPWQEVLAQVVL